MHTIITICYVHVAYVYRDEQKQDSGSNQCISILATHYPVCMHRRVMCRLGQNQLRVLRLATISLCRNLLNGVALS